MSHPAAAVLRAGTKRRNPGGPTPPAPDKSGYTIFDPTPAMALRGFNTDRPTKRNSPITMDAGRVQYETDVFSYTHSKVNLSHAITPKLTAYAEFYSALGTDQRTPPVYTADLALAYLLTNTLQLDVGTSIGPNCNSPNLQAHTSMSQRF